MGAFDGDTPMSTGASPEPSGKQSGDGCPGGAHRVLGGEDHVVRDLGVLAGEREVHRAIRSDLGAVAVPVDHELAGDIRHQAAGAGRSSGKLLDGLACGRSMSRAIGPRELGLTARHH
jgi:hypothetical protein